MVQTSVDICNIVLRITLKSRAKVCAQWRILKPPGSLVATDRSKAVVLV